MGEGRFSASTRLPEAEPETTTRSREADRRLYHVVVATIASFCLVVVSGQLKTMAGEIVAVWIADGYLLGHLMAVPRRSKPSILIGGVIGNLVANLRAAKASTYLFPSPRAVWSKCVRLLGFCRGLVLRRN